MAIYRITAPNGGVYTITGPEGLTREQAQDVAFEQFKTGALVGLEPGTTINAVTQAAAGLASAKAQIGQALSKITGALGGGIASAVGQIGSVVSGIANQVTGIATSAVSSITGILSKTPITNGIDTANFAKQATALMPIGSLDVSQVTGTLAQAKNLVGQASSAVTNLKGVGSYGFSAQQLESAGIVKPGTANLLASGANSLTSVLKSPSVFTGKDGITNISGLLNNTTVQDKIQQTLMSSGVASLGSLGIPTDALDPAKLSGLALSAAKDLPSTESLLKGLPVPSDIANMLKTNIRDGAFAVDFSTDKLADAFKEIEVPVIAKDTVNRATLDAASKRILGNPKIPFPNYGPPTA